MYAKGTAANTPLKELHAILWIIFQFDENINVINKMHQKKVGDNETNCFRRSLLK